eukprot:6189531-Pleurochrysis_carterae.AAC.1
MFSIEFPNWLNVSVKQDANHFIWKSKTLFSKDSIGTKGRTGKYINKAATHLPLTKGGAGFLNWRAHTKAFQAHWIVSLLQPREAPWKKIFTHWTYPTPPEYLVHLTTPEKIKLKKRIREEQHIIKKALTAFWLLKLKMSKESSKLIDPDKLLAFSILHNPLFKIRRQIQAEWHLHPQLARIDTLITEKGQNRTATQIRAIIKEMLPNIDTATLKKLISHAQSIQKRIPSWLKRRLDTDRKRQPHEIVKIKDFKRRSIWNIHYRHTPPTKSKRIRSRYPNRLTLEHQRVGLGHRVYKSIHLGHKSTRKSHTGN